MAITINGKLYPTISDASEHFKVSAKTIREWIEKGVIPIPPTVEYGTRELQVFSEDYLKKADISRAEYKKRKAKNRPKRKNKDVKSL